MYIGSIIVSPKPRRSVEYNVVLLVFGILLLLVGLVGKVKAKELEVGTGSAVARVVLGVIGIGLMALSLALSPASKVISRFASDTLGTGTEAEVTNRGSESLPVQQDDRGAVAKDRPVSESVVLDAKVAIVSVGKKSAEALSPSIAAMETVKHDALNQLGILNPDLIIVAADTRGVWSEMSPRVLRSLFVGKKVVALGNGGAELLQVLGATIGRGSAMHGAGLSEIVLENFPFGFVDRPSLPTKFSVHSPVRSDVLGIYDAGSPALRGFEAFARWPTHKNHWTIARQGNLLFWGYDAPLDTLTNEGRTLLIALIRDHHDRPFVSFEDRLPRIEPVQPGLHSDKLSKDFSSHTWHIQLSRPGYIHATLRSDSTTEPLTLLLNGPGKIGYFERKDGKSPLEISFDVTEDLLARGDIWRISVTKFGEIPKPIVYEIELKFPVEPGQ